MSIHTPGLLSSFACSFFRSIACFLTAYVEDFFKPSTKGSIPHQYETRVPRQFDYAEKHIQ